MALTPATVAQTPTDLSLWVFVDRHGDFMVKQAERWNAANPDRPINLTYEAIPYEDMHNNLLAAFMAGQGAPDLVDIEIGKFSTFVKTEDNVHLLDLTAEVAPYLPDLVATRMAPYQAYGKQLGIDYHLGAYLMYYNRALLEQAGIDPDAIKTWDDYVAAGKRSRRSSRTSPGRRWAATSSSPPTGSCTERRRPLRRGRQPRAEQPGERRGAPVPVPTSSTSMASPSTTPGGNVHSADSMRPSRTGVASIWMPQWYMTRFPDNMPSRCAAA